MESKASRQSFGEEIALLGERNPNIVVLDADLSKSTYSHYFAKKFPQRFFEMGIAEANMIGTAAGMALAGKVAYICSFACFVTGRYDIIRMSIAYPKSNVKIVGTHAGIGVGEDGNSQQGLEDITLMRGLPNMIVLQPGDDLETRQCVQFATKHHGPVYLRLSRQKLSPIHHEGYSFQVGKADIIREGTDATLFSSGPTIFNTLIAADLLQQKSIHVRVVNCGTIKPIDKEMVKRCAKETKALFTIEDHNIIGGLGSAICEAAAETCPAPVHRLGLMDCFGESGTPEELYQKFQLDPQGIAYFVRSHLVENR